MSSDYKNIQIRRGLNSEFIDANPVLRSGEPAYTLDTKILKIGDGITAWNSLSSFGSDLSGILSNSIQTQINSLLDGAPDALNTLNELAAAINDDQNFASTFIASGTKFINDLNVVSGIALTSGDNISLLSNNLNYIVSNIEAASGADLISNIISLTQVEYDAITPESGIFYVIVDASGSSSYLSSLSQDTTPQLGGDLDLNNHNIIGTGNIEINGSGNFSNGVYINDAPAIKSDTTGISGVASGVYNIVVVDQNTFDNIPTKDPNTIYYIQ